MTVVEVVAQVFSSVFAIALPFGFTFGALIVCIWSLPLLAKLVKSLL